MKNKEVMINRNKLLEVEKEVNIPAYADDKIQTKIRNRELEKERKLKEEEKRKDKEQRKIRREEYKKTLIPIKEINVILKVLLGVLFCMTIFALVKVNIAQALYGAIGMYLTVFVGQRARLKDGEITDLDNALLWNLSEFINQIIEYKTEYDIESIYVSLFNKACYVLIASMLLFSSSGLFYILSLIAFIISLLICIGFKDFEPIIDNQAQIMGCALIGLILKFIFALFIYQSVSIDCFNVLMILGFSYLDVLKQFKIQEPK